MPMCFSYALMVPVGQSNVVNKRGTADMRKLQISWGAGAGGHCEGAGKHKSYIF